MATFVTTAQFVGSPQIVSFLATRLDDTTRKTLEEKKASNDFTSLAPEKAIDELISSGHASPSTITALSFLQALWLSSSDAAEAAPDVATTAVAVCGWILGGLASDVSSATRQVVDLLFPRSALDQLISGPAALRPADAKSSTPPTELTSTVLARLRLNVFNREPLRTLLRLLREGCFSQVIEAPVAARVQAFMTVMIEEARDVSDKRLPAHASKRLDDRATTASELSEALEIVQSLKELARITEDPEDIPIIYGRHYRYIRAITQADEEAWVDQMVAAGMAREKAGKAYDSAERIDCWNENLWLALMQSRRAKYTPIVPRPAAPPSRDDDDDELPAGAGNNLTDMFRLQDKACETCCSVTSLSAYFADLLSLLRATPCGPTNLLEILRRRRPDLTKLQLTCANAQTLVPYVALVNEVLESFILSRTGSGYASVRAYNVPDTGAHDHADATVHYPGNANPDVYGLVATQMHPFAHFPYSQARDSLTHYFATFNISMRELVATFQSKELVLRNVPAELLATAGPSQASPGQRLAERRRRLDAGARDVLERCLAAETLALQAPDFAAITGETFYPAWLADWIMGLSEDGDVVDKGCPWTAADVWGYEAATFQAKLQAAVDESVEAGETPAVRTITPAMAAAAAKQALLDPQRGLSRVQKELMRRSGLAYQDILDLVRTRCFSQHLVLTNTTGSDQFTNSLEELRLLSNASEPPFRPLNEALVFAMQSFLRVKAKLGWPARHVDAAVVCLRNLELASSPSSTRTNTSTTPGSAQELIQITPFVVKGLAAVVGLGELRSGIEPAAFLPLWGPIDSYGDDCLLRRKFLTPAAAEVDKLFGIPVKPAVKGKLADYFKILRPGPGGKGSKRELASFPLGLHKAGICVSLNWPVEFWGDLLAASGQRGKDLDVPVFSALYRYVLLCRILGIAPAQSGLFFDMFHANGGKNALASPLATLAVIKQWKGLLDAGWTINSLAAVTAPVSPTPPEPAGMGGASAGATPESRLAGLATAAAIVEGTQNVYKVLPFVAAAGAAKAATASDVADCAARTFDPTVASLVAEFVEGAKTQSETVMLDSVEYLDAVMAWASASPSPPSALSLKIKLVPEIDLQGEAAIDVQLSGILSPAEMDKIKDLAVTGLPPGQTGRFRDALLAMNRRAVEPWDKLVTRFGADRCGTFAVLQDWPDAGASSADAEALAAALALQVRERRRAFVDLAGPTVIQDLLEAFVLNVVKDLVPDLDVAVVAAIVWRVARVASWEDETSSVTAMTALKELSAGATTSLDGQPLDAYFTPNTTDVFTLIYTGPPIAGADGQSPWLTMNGLGLRYDSKSREFVSTRMRGGQAYLLKANFPPSQLQLSTPKLLQAPIPGKMLLSSNMAHRGAEINASILRVATVCRTMRLNADELGYFASALQSNRSVFAGAAGDGDDEGAVGGDDGGTSHEEGETGADGNDAAVAPAPGASTSRKMLLAVDLNAPSFEELVQLNEYCELRRNIRPTSSQALSAGQQQPLLVMVSWLCTTTTATLGEIAAALHQGTGWDRARVLAAVKAKYPISSAAAPEGGGEEEDGGAVLAALRADMGALYSLQAVMALDDKLGRASGGAATQPSMETLFDLARPARVLARDDAGTARRLQSRLLPEQRAQALARTMENQRRALVTYLLQQRYVRKELRVWDADGLFEYFLIDVQMGAGLATSRIKQAVSVVQLFAQRCLLGLEPGVPKTCLVRAKWDWMQQHSLWEAHRKLFLYPENWLDPALRDDKSEPFARFEASLMRKNLSLPTFVESMRTYIGALNDIASLETVAYAHEPAAGAADTFHLFGRTRAAPHGVYYRKLTVQWPSGARLWLPWSKIEIDVPSVESNWDGSRLAKSGTYLLPVLQGGRLYLFMPHIMPRTLDRQTPVPNEPGTFDGLKQVHIADMAPRRIWDITMAWSELASGSWLPKRMSPGSVSVQSAEMPAAGDFRVDTISGSGASLTLLVSCTDADSGRARVVGHFVFKADQMSAVDLRADERPPLPALDRAMPTSFQQIMVQVDWSSPNTTYSALTVASQAEKAPTMLAWVPDALDTVQRLGALAPRPGVALGSEQVPARQLTWTLSMDPNEGRLTGLALSAQRADGTATSYFNVPRTEMRSMWWTADNMRTKMDTVVMDHAAAQGLVQAATDTADPLKSIARFMASVAASCGLEAFGAYGNRGICHELGQPSALYNWEVGLHAVMLAMDRFHATQQYDEALQVARLVFDPTVDADVERLVKQIATQDAEGNAKSTFEVVVSPLATAASALSALEKLPAGDQTTISLGTRRLPGGSAWRFPPFQDLARRIQDGAYTPDGTAVAADGGSELEAAILERRSHGSLVHATARGRPEAYMKWIVLKYAEILVASGDAHFRRGTLESLPLATQRYVEATHVLGPDPPRAPGVGDRRNLVGGTTFEDLTRDREPWTFERLFQEDASFGIGLPYSPELELVRGGAVPAGRDKRKEGVVGFLRTPYFGVPLNPKFQQVRSTIRQRLFNVRNSLDIDGRPVSYALMEPSLDPGALLALDGGGGGGGGGQGGLDGAAMVLGLRDSPLPRQRFEAWIHRALELAGEARALGERLVAAIEKKEAEALGVLRAQHTTSIQRMMLDIKEMQITEARQNIDALRLSRETAVSQLAYYLALVGEPESLIPRSDEDGWKDLGQTIDAPTRDDLRMSPHEATEMDMARAAMALNVISAGIDTLVAPFCLVPSVSVNAMPLGVGTTVAAGGGSTISAFMQAGSAALKMAALVVAEEGGQAARKAQLTRQLQERRLQANLHGREVKGLDMQIRIQETRVRAAQRELALQQAELDESARVEAWLRTKYSNEQLYGWVEKSVRSLYFDAYSLAIGTARSAESALAFETGGGRPSILRPGGYWDASRDGLLAADRLFLDLKRLEAAYRDGGRRHDYEVSKTVSLRQVDPMALLRLRATGSTTWALPELLFDLDFPGHYMRRIRSVAVSIPAVLGPHTAVNATLTLQQHKYRVSPAAGTGEEYAASWASASSGPGGDDAFRTDRVPIASVALSAGSAHDPGVFELAFGGDKYQPFEGAGAVSAWRLDLPTEVRRFDYGTIADVLLHVQYTALDGGAGLRAAANGAVRMALQAASGAGAAGGGFWAMWSLQDDFVGHWHRFTSQLAAARADKGPGAAAREVSMTLGNLYERLPFWARQLGDLEVRGIALISASVALVNALSVSVANKTRWDSQLLGKWQVRSNKKLQEAAWDGWEVKAKAGDIKPGDTVSDVYMLVCFAKKA